MKLTIELVPQSCWFSNVRSEISSTQWAALRQQVCSAAWDTCQICGGTGDKHPVECHEIWEYDDQKLIQKLVGMIALCPDCHMVKHFGYATLRGKSEDAIKHLMKVNKLNKKQANKYIKDAFAIWQQRSAKQWTLDISILVEYGIDVSKIVKPNER